MRIEEDSLRSAKLIPFSANLNTFEVSVDLSSMSPEETHSLSGGTGGIPIRIFHFHNDMCNYSIGNVRDHYVDISPSEDDDWLVEDDTAISAPDGFQKAVFLDDSIARSAPAPNDPNVLSKSDVGFEFVSAQVCVLEDSFEQFALQKAAGLVSQRSGINGPARPGASSSGYELARATSYAGMVRSPRTTLSGRPA